MRIGTRLTGGFLLLSLLMGFVGYMGINSTRLIQQNNQIELDERKLTALLDRSLMLTLQLIGTKNLSEYNRIKLNLEDTRKEFDLLHKETKQSGYGFLEEISVLEKSIGEFTIISNGIIGIHKEKLVQNKELDEKRALEKNLRYDTASISYQFITKRIEEIVIDQKKAEDTELLETNKLTEIINKLQTDKERIISNMHAKNTSLTNGIFKTLLIRIVILLFIALSLGLYISRSISKPIVELTTTAQMIASGNLTKRAEVRSSDEVGQLAESFNKMVKSLIRLEAVEKEKEKIKAILQSIGDGVFMINKQLKIMMFNPAAAEISGFSAQEALGKRYDKVLKFVYEKDGKMNDNFIKKCLKTGKAQEMSNHTVLIKKDGSKLPVADSAAPIMGNDKKIIGCVAVFRNIAKEREVDKMKTEFISLASHQLRTPLSALSWFGEMLLNGDAGKLNKEQKEFVQNIYQSSQRMTSLVSALLNVARIESGRIIIDPKPTDLRKLIQGVLDELQVDLEEKKQKLIFSVHKDLSKINIDPKLIRHVYLNLLTNAIRYTPEKGEISIFVSKKGDKVVSQVSDTGYGVSKKQQSKVFQKFFRGENIVKLETKGTGLGLYLAKAVVESSGGKIWFESEENKGTTFWFTLPISGMRPKKGEVSLDS